MSVDIPKLRELIAVMNETGSQDTHEEARAMLVKAMPEVLDRLEAAERVVEAMKRGESIYDIDDHVREYDRVKGGG